MLAKNLKYLNLSRNGITFLERQTFVYLKQLKTLDLSENSIKLVDENALKGISSTLTFIDLSKNYLREFRQKDLIELAKFKNNPTTINLSNNRIESVEAVFETPKYIYNTDLFQYPYSYSVSDNHVASLNLQNNKIKEYSSTGLKIDELNLKNNGLEKLTLRSPVIILDVDDNKLKELFITDSTRNVSASNNKIETLKSDKKLEIESLKLSRNKITNGMLAMLKTASKLKVLDLSGNALNELELDTFADMALLKLLNLDNSSIKNISYGLFTHQKKLKTLNISHNNLGVTITITSGRCCQT